MDDKEHDNNANYKEVSYLEEVKEGPFQIPGVFRSSEESTAFQVRLRNSGVNYLQTCTLTHLIIIHSNVLYLAIQKDIGLIALAVNGKKVLLSDASNTSPSVLDTIDLTEQLQSSDRYIRMLLVSDIY